MGPRELGEIPEELGHIPGELGGSGRRRRREEGPRELGSFDRCAFFETNPFRDQKNARARPVALSKKRTKQSTL